MQNLSSVGRVVISLVLLGVAIGGFLWMGTPVVETRPPEKQQPPVVKTSLAQEHTDGIW